MLYWYCALSACATRSPQEFEWSLVSQQTQQWYFVQNLDVRAEKWEMHRAEGTRLCPGSGQCPPTEVDVSECSKHVSVRAWVRSQGTGQELVTGRLAHQLGVCFLCVSLRCRGTGVWPASSHVGGAAGHPKGQARLTWTRSQCVPFPRTPASAEVAEGQGELGGCS